MSGYEDYVIIEKAINMHNMLPCKRFVHVEEYVLDHASRLLTGKR